MHELVHAHWLRVVRRLVPVLDRLDRPDDVVRARRLLRAPRAAPPLRGDSPSSIQPFGSCQRPSCVRISATSKPPPSPARNTTPPAETSVAGVHRCLPCALATAASVRRRRGRSSPPVSAGSSAVPRPVRRRRCRRHRLACAAVHLDRALRHRLQRVRDLAEERALRVRAVLLAGLPAGTPVSSSMPSSMVETRPDVELPARTASRPPASASGCARCPSGSSRPARP